MVLFENPIGNLLTKLVIILGAFFVSEKATNLITGILADNAGMQSISAGDMSDTAKKAVAMGTGLVGMKGATGKALGLAGFGLKAGLKTAVGAGMLTGYGLYGAGKGAVTGGKALARKISAWRNGGSSPSGGGGGSSSTPGTGGSGSNSTSTPKIPPKSARG